MGQTAKQIIYFIKGQKTLAKGQSPPQELEEG